MRDGRSTKGGGGRKRVGAEKIGASDGVSTIGWPAPVACHAVAGSTVCEDGASAVMGEREASFRTHPRVGRVVRVCQRR